MNKHIALVVLAMALLAGCSTQASRMVECEAQGVSKDACYIADKNHQTSIENAAESQALRNAAAQYGQAARKYPKIDARFTGMKIKISPQNKQIRNASTTALLISEKSEHVEFYCKGIFRAMWSKLIRKIMLLCDSKLVGKHRT